MRAVRLTMTIVGVAAAAVISATAAGAADHADHVSIDIDSLGYSLDADADSGDLAITDNRFEGVADSVKGTVTAGAATVAISLTRPPLLPVGAGTIRIDDPSAGVSARAQVITRIVDVGSHEVAGSTVWLDGRRFPPRARRITWTVRDADPGPGDHVTNIVHDGRPRTFIVHAPPGYDASTATPMLVMLHGAGSPTAWSQDLFQNMTAQSDIDGFLLALPAGVRAVWNQSGGPGADPGFDTGVDDVGFLDAMLDDIEADFAVDAQRIYVSGFSNGGGMTHRLACQRADRYAAFAPLHITKPTTYPCTPGRPVPILMMAGTADPLVDYNASSDTRLDMEGTVAFWRDANGCEADPTVDPVPDLNPNDATTALHRTYQGCDVGGVVEFYEITGGGHNWPGAPPFLPPQILGRNNLDIDGNATVWDFVSQFTLPD